MGVLVGSISLHLHHSSNRHSSSLRRNSSHCRSKIKRRRRGDTIIILMRVSPLVLPTLSRMEMVTLVIVITITRRGVLQ
jgi:hypothetical protein